MEPVAPKPSRLDLHSPYESSSPTPPSVKRIMPLRIVKRSDSSSGLGPDDADDRSPRTCSRETDESRGSAPEPPEGEQQLTIPKVRGSRSSRVFGGLDDVDESPVPLGRDPYLPKDFGGFRDRCFMSPRQGMSPPYRPFPGLLGDIIQRSRTSNSLFPSDSDGPLHISGDEHEQQCSILVPEVRVTPDTKAVDHGYHDFWVAIEVEGTGGGHGAMYDVKVDVEATAHSSVLEVIRNYSAPGTLGPGSRILVLANVELRLLPANYYPVPGGHHVRSQSDELMEDLEDHLGSARCEYLRVNLVYRHTAFPSVMPTAADPNDKNYNNNGIDNDININNRLISTTTTTTGGAGGGGITGCQTKIRTTFTASIARHNAASPWSPPPAPTPSRLAGVIAAHWGMDAADELLQTRLARRRRRDMVMAPRKTTYLACPGNIGSGHSSGNSYGNCNSYRAPRRGLCGPRWPPAMSARVDENERDRDRDRDRDMPRGGMDCDGDGVVGDEYDPASRIWARLRRGSGFSCGSGSGGGGGGGGGNGSVGGHYRGPAAGSKTSLTDMTNQQQAVGVETLDRKRGIGIRKVSGKSRRGSGRWGFGNWWA